MQTYTIPKPAMSLVGRAMGLLLVIGLIGLGTAAYAAFAYIGHWWQALAFALVIEVTAIVESLALMRGNRWAIPGVVISLGVSGVYNFTQAQQAAAHLATPLAWWQLLALSIGPMSSVFFVSLALGREIRALEAAVEKWEQERQVFLTDQAERQARREERREQRQERLEVERQRVEVLSQLPGTSTQPVGSSTSTSRGRYEDFLELLSSNGHHEWKNQELANRFHVSTRTITEWRTRYREEHPEPAQESN